MQALLARQFFLSEKQKSIQELTFLEGQKIGYKFPYYQSKEGSCYLAVKPGFSEQCRTLEGPEQRKESGLSAEAECTDGSECQCDAFDWQSPDGSIKEQMQCAAISP